MTRRKITEAHEPARGAPTERQLLLRSRARRPNGGEPGRAGEAEGRTTWESGRARGGRRGSSGEPRCDRAARRREPATRELRAAAPQSVARTLAESGHALPKPLRHEMEGAFARDFSQVRVHSDTSARESATAINARAYTHGNDIVLGEGVPSMASAAGRHLLAHELTHVTQQHEGVIHRQTIASQMPKELDVVSVSVSLTIPGGKQLTDNWNDLSTTDSTRVDVSLLRTSLTMSLYPAPSHRHAMAVERPRILERRLRLRDWKCHQRQSL